MDMEQRMALAESCQPYGGEPDPDVDVALEQELMEPFYSFVLNLYTEENYSLNLVIHGAGRWSYVEVNETDPAGETRPKIYDVIEDQPVLTQIAMEVDLDEWDEIDKEVKQMKMEAAGI